MTAVLVALAIALFYVASMAAMAVHHRRHPECRPYRTDAELRHRTPDNDRSL